MLIALVFSTAATAAQVQTQAQMDAAARALYAEAERVYETDLRKSAMLSQRALAALDPAAERALRREIEAHLCMSLSGFAAERALALAESGLRVATREHDRLSAARFITCKAYATEVAGDMATAAEMYERALSAAQASEDREAIADALAYRGENRHYQGRYDDALVDLNRAFDLYTRIGETGGRRYTLNAMANLYSDPHVGEFDKAIEYYRQILKQDLAVGAKGAVATALFNIASAYEEKGEYVAALRDFRRALAIDRALGDRDAVIEEERAIGRVLTAQGKPQDAMPMIDRALAYYAEASNADALARTRIVRATALRKLGRFDDALREIDQARAHFLLSDNSRYLTFVYAERGEILAAQGNWREAYAQAQALREVESRLEKRLRQERTSRLRVQFDAARKEEQNAQLQAENRRRTAELESARRVRNLQRAVIALCGALLLLLGTMALQQLQRNRKMRALAMTDDLTALPNRRHILEYLDERRKAAAENNMPLALIAFDVDHFKRINDRYGHGVGDRVLASVARLVADGLRAEDRVGRIGGEEFLIVSPATTRADAEAI
ncbi:MAG: diguanylate cyclase, partial [Xanthomonadaceae bacterium]|nr:diguanylate cyclase [Xanthomonadaceae bacterium]